jgi:hypothetical protein
MTELTWRFRLALACVAVGTVLTVWCLIVTTAISMTFFLGFGVPLYLLGAALYAWEIIIDLKRHDVL